MTDKQYDLVVIGAGPGGYVAAIRAAQLGMKVGLVEKAAVPGGTCLRIGCIPSKALLESSERFAAIQSEFKDHGIVVKEWELNLDAMMKRKTKIVSNLAAGIQSLLKKSKIDLFQGTAAFQDPTSVTLLGDSANSEVLRANHFLIATGSRPKHLPGLTMDGVHVISSTEALSLAQVPKHLIVVGAGAIGLELGSVWLRLGAKVTVIEFLDRILPGMDSEVAGQAQKELTKQGMTFHLGAKVAGVDVNDGECTVNLEGSKSIKGDRVLVAVGREANTDGLQLPNAKIETDRHGRIPVNDQFQTATENIYAIGDVIAGPMLAHKAEEEGMAVADHLAGRPIHINYDAIPNVVYTHPEIASVGQTEDQLSSASRDYRKGVFPFRANGRAHALGTTSGMVKVLADGRTDRILGIHIIGPHAGELINEAATAIAFAASSEDLGNACHAHPTLSEALKEAALATQGRAIHF